MCVTSKLTNKSRYNPRYILLSEIIMHAFKLARSTVGKDAWDDFASYLS